MQGSTEENVIYEHSMADMNSSKDLANNILFQLDRFSVPVIKTYQLHQTLPDFARELFNNKAILIREEKTQSFPKSTCSYTVRLSL